MNKIIPVFNSRYHTSQKFQQLKHLTFLNYFKGFLNNNNNKKIKTIRSKPSQL